MADWPLRLRALLDRHFAVVVAALVALALVGGWMTYSAHATPTTTTEERTVSSWQATGWFNHSATVTENNSVYPVGTTLTDRPIYFTGIAPSLDGTYSFRYDASDRGELNETVSLQVVLRSVEGNQETKTVVWKTTESLGTASNESLEPGEAIRVPFSINVSEIVNRTDVIEQQLDNPPGRPEMIIRAAVDIQGTVNGRTVDQEIAHTLPVELEQGSYRPAIPGKTTDRHETTRRVTVQQSTSSVWTLGGPAILLGSLVALAGLVTARSRGVFSLSRAEQEWLSYTDDRSDFDEWISTIALPADADDRPAAEASSLSSLVDFAIDTDNRVIETPGGDAYHVLHDGYRYTYRPPQLDEAVEAGADEEVDTPETDADEPGAATNGPVSTDGRGRPLDDPFEE